MQKVTFNRDHLEYKKGETIEVTEERAAYFANVGVADAAEEKPKTAAEVIELIKSATTAKEINALTKGEERVTVLDAADKRKADLKNSK